MVSIFKPITAIKFQGYKETCFFAILGCSFGSTKCIKAGGNITPLRKRCAVRKSTRAWSHKKYMMTSHHDFMFSIGPSLWQSHLTNLCHCSPLDNNLNISAVCGYFHKCQEGRWNTWWKTRPMRECYMKMCCKLFLKVSRRNWINLWQMRKPVNLVLASDSQVFLYLHVHHFALFFNRYLSLSFQTMETATLPSLLHRPLFTKFFTPAEYLFPTTKHHITSYYHYHWHVIFRLLFFKFYWFYKGGYRSTLLFSWLLLFLLFLP